MKVSDRKITYISIFSILFILIYFNKKNIEWGRGKGGLTIFGKKIKIFGMLVGGNSKL